ncbi:hypothetical protein JTE90_027042 [Oedothorax gibbosus]|uniref:Uncharacterized protein n=1 Tax=Oedothorax gibbosus TaxID=931172 RepID=A0AAV6UTI0_9ARAC|nr:hypothetical protein JTE90_027042 [Oedothorax gibbosus]
MSSFPLPELAISPRCSLQDLASLWQQDHPSEVHILLVYFVRRVTSREIGLYSFPPARENSDTGKSPK